MTKIVEFFRSRLPSKENTLQLFGVIVTLFYSYTILSSLMDFSKNWVLYLNIGDLVGIFAYILAGTFLECLLLLGVLVLIAFILPSKLLADKFTIYGTVLVISLTGSLIYLYSQASAYDILAKSYLWFRAFASGSVILLVLTELFPFIRRTISFLSERFVVFLYIYIPLSIISIFIVILRNLSV